MKFKLQPYNLQELGKRQNQEDSLFPGIDKQTKDDRLFILCDGMGGHEKGEVASATVCETMSNTILSRWNPSEPLSDELLQQAISDAYDALDAKDNGEAKKMGTTMTLVCFHSEGVTVAHIGDSRIYQLRPAGYARREDSLRIDKWPSSIVHKTRDHSLVNDLIDIGEITEEEAKDHPQKNVITRAMQPCQERRAKATIAHLTDIQDGDYFYMCSDGMLEQTSDENLLNIITKKDARNEQKVEMLRSVTEDNKDNHTAHLIYINKVERTPAPVLSDDSSVKGVFITPDSAQPKKKSALPLILAAIFLAAIVIGASFLFSDGKTDSDENAKAQDSAKVEQPKRDASHHKARQKPVAPKPEEKVDNNATSKDQPAPAVDNAAKSQTESTKQDANPQQSTTQVPLSSADPQKKPKTREELLQIMKQAEVARKAKPTEPSQPQK